MDYFPSSQNYMKCQPVQSLEKISFACYFSSQPARRTVEANGEKRGLCS